MSKSKWQEYKENLGETRPWDIVNLNIDTVSEKDATNRLNICKACPELIQITKQCKKCACFMKAKTKLLNATCPIGKW